MDKIAFFYLISPEMMSHILFRYENFFLWYNGMNTLSLPDYWWLVYATFKVLFVYSWTGAFYCHKNLLARYKYGSCVYFGSSKFHIIHWIIYLLIPLNSVFYCLMNRSLTNARGYSYYLLPCFIPWLKYVSILEWFISEIHNPCFSVIIFF